MRLCCTREFNPKLAVTCAAGFIFERDAIFINETLIQKQIDET